MYGFNFGLDSLNSLGLNVGIWKKCRLCSFQCTALCIIFVCVIIKHVKQQQQQQQHWTPCTTFRQMHDICYRFLNQENNNHWQQSLHQKSTWLNNQGACHMLQSERASHFCLSYISSTDSTLESRHLQWCVVWDWQHLFFWLATEEACWSLHPLPTVGKLHTTPTHSQALCFFHPNVFKTPKWSQTP